MPTSATVLVQHTSKGAKPKDKQTMTSFHSPNLYKTPESAPIPHVPSSYNSCPYLINHKRRGLRIPPQSEPANIFSVNSRYEDDKKIRVSENGRKLEESTVHGKNDVNGKNRPLVVEAETGSEKRDDKDFSSEIDSCWNRHFEFRSNQDLQPEQLDEEVLWPFMPDRSASCKGDFTERIVTSDENEDRSVNDEIICFRFPLDDGNRLSPRDADCTPRTQRSEFFDADDDLSLSIEDTTAQSVERDIFRLQSEIDSLKAKILTEVEKRVKLEQTLSCWQKSWIEMAIQLSSASGLSLPSFESLMASNGDQARVLEYVEEACGRITVARTVAEAFGRVLIRAVLTQNMKDPMQTKDFEISRLRDKVHYHELIICQMSRRNQEVMELGRRCRAEQRKRKRWFWLSVALSVVIGGASIAYKYVTFSHMRYWIPVLEKNTEKCKSTNVD